MYGEFLVFDRAFTVAGAHGAASTLGDWHCRKA